MKSHFFRRQMNIIQFQKGKHFEGNLRFLKSVWIHWLYLDSFGQVTPRRELLGQDHYVGQDSWFLAGAI